MITRTETEPWRILPNESGYAYSLFTLYLKMPPGKRSLKRVAAEAGRTKRSIEAFSAQNDWVSRCRAYDVHLCEIALKSKAKKTKNA